MTFKGFGIKLPKALLRFKAHLVKKKQYGHIAIVNIQQICNRFQEKGLTIVYKMLIMKLVKPIAISQYISRVFKSRKKDG